MPLKELNLKKYYNALEDDVIHDFFIPTLSEAILYQRAVGYFSSSSLIAITVGISKFINNGGKIQLICSPNLRDTDIEDIYNGYENRCNIEDIITSNFLSELNQEFNKFECERLGILSYLITNGMLDIKVAIPEKNSNNAMFHDKIGVLTDINDDVVSFSGSMNDSVTAYKLNSDSFDVYTSYSHDFERAYVKKNIFERLWNNDFKGLKVIDFPKEIKDKIYEYKKDNVNFDIDEEEFFYKVDENIPKIPSYIKLRNYQNEAIDNWRNNNYRGIYDMATGSGKTITGLASVIDLLNEKDNNLFIIICCPYQHLVEQWIEDIVKFNIKYIVGYSSSKMKNWKEKLKQNIFNYNNDLIKYGCFITTNATFSTKFIQDNINLIKKDILLLVDEAHNFGTVNLSNMLDERFKYRLALSATLERHNDLVGTTRLYDYFEKKCIEYTLENAINDNMLTPYEYYPIAVYLNENELEEYKELSSKLLKFIYEDKFGNKTFKKGAEILLIKRARIIAGAENKIPKLLEIMKNYQDDKQMLVYCGAATVVDKDFDKSEIINGEIRQIEKVSSDLYNKLGIKSSRFTSQENAESRANLIENFRNGDIIQALIAIRCLDEGVNIPNIKTAFILASSTNPKEYVQRRGRVLRLSPGKEYAKIYDFITLPRNLEDVTDYDELDFEMSLIKREVIRMKDFANLALNSRVADSLLDEIESVYGRINIDSEKERDI